MMNEAERESIEFVLTDGYRNHMLTIDDSKASGISDHDPEIHAMLPAWEWFQKRAKLADCICGLVFRLADMGAVKDSDPSKMVRDLTIGSIVEAMTDGESTDGESTDGESTEGDATEGAEEESSG